MAKKKNAKEKKGVDVSWRDIFSWKKLLITFTIIVILTFFAYHFGFLKKTCDTEECFNNALDSCSPAKYLKLQNLNYYKYAIKGQRGDECLVSIELKKMAEGTSLEKKVLFENKGMECRIPLEKMDELKAENLENVLDYCTGPLKEAMYKLIIQKLYTIIIGNMGNVLGEIENTLKNPI